jgi:hypothetical protein
MRRDKMEKPNINLMWETFIKTSRTEIIQGEHVNTIRRKITPLVYDLKEKGMVNWYCFLVHNRNTGVPTTDDDNNPYFHIIFGLNEGVDSKDFERYIENKFRYCIMTRKKGDGTAISGFDDISPLTNGDIEDLWRIIGKASEWILEMLSLYKEEVEIPPNHVMKFLHYYANMTQMALK